MTQIIAKPLIVGGETIVSQPDWNAELETKYARLTEFLKTEGLAGLIIKRTENVAWATGGAVETRVVIPSDTGVGTLLITAAGKRYYFSQANEAPRLHDEEFAALDFEPIVYPWYEDPIAEQSRRICGGPVGTDYPLADFKVVNLFPLRASLSEPEIARYRWLGHQTADATADVLTSLETGLTEFDLEAIVSSDLISRGILPTVLLMAVDDRILKYKHAVARGAYLQKYGMLNLCSRKWGLVVSITRFVHFGPLPSELADRFAAVAQVNAALLHASRVGATGAELFSVVQQAYANHGFPGEEQLHHQGGPTGYEGREWVATPSGAQVVVDNQAFAWNPSIRGGKAEDTVILQNGKIENLTPTPTLPIVETTIGSQSYKSAGVLIR